MKPNQRNVFSLLEQIKAELTEDDQSPGINQNLGKDSSAVGMEAEGPTREGEILKVLDGNLEGKAGGSERIISFDSTDKYICPRCDKKELVRIRRHKWMRLLPRSSHYRCLECKARFLVVWRLEIKIPKWHR
jgi:hypothetical protein